MLARGGEACHTCRKYGVRSEIEFDPHGSNPCVGIAVAAGIGDVLQIRLDTEPGRELDFIEAFNRQFVIVLQSRMAAEVGIGNADAQYVAGTGRGWHWACPCQAGASLPVDQAYIRVGKCALGKNANAGIACAAGIGRLPYGLIANGISATKDMALHCCRADILVAAVGKPGMIGPQHVKEGAVVIDVGINRITLPDGSKKTVGDVDFDLVREKAGYITPVPGGVGPMTVAMLLKNTLACAELTR